MSIFYGGYVSVASNTATKLVDAAEVGRYVYLSSAPERLGFASTEVSSGSGSFSIKEFALPAGKELWAYTASAQDVRILVTTK